MRLFEIFVDHKATLTDDPTSRQDAPRGLSLAAARADARIGTPRSRAVFDLFVNGANVTARIAESEGTCVLRDLARAVADLGRAPRRKRIVRFYDDACELAIERIGDDAALSVYRSGPVPEVMLYDERVPFADVYDSVKEAVEGALAARPLGAVLEIELADARALLAAAPVASGALKDDAVLVSTEIDRNAPIALSCEFAMRTFAAEKDEVQVERADLHALLFRGRVRAEVRGRSVDLGEGLPFFFAEKFAEMARALLSSWETGQAIHARVETGGFVLGVRSTPEGAVSLTLGTARGAHLMLAKPRLIGDGQPFFGTPAAMRDRTVVTFPALSTLDVVEAALSFGRGLVRAIVRRDRSQARNLRIAAFKRTLRETSDAVREVRLTDEIVNVAPESYRVFSRAKSDDSGRRLAQPDGAPPSSVPQRLTYTQKWRALVPGIDLRATFLCGERLVVGGTSQTYCLARSTGEVLWRRPTERATSVVTPGGIARISPDGAVAIHDLGTGEVTLRTWIAPRVGGPCAGAVVNAQGLPRLLIVTEGERHLVAIDLLSGEVRWRHAWGRRGALRLKRAGKLLFVASGDSALTALDVVTGLPIWRVRDRLCFRTSPTLCDDSLFAVTGGAGGRATLLSLDPFAGTRRFERALEGGRACTIEGAPLVSGNTVAVAVRDRHGLVMVGLDRETGQERWRREPPVVPLGTSWLPVDDAFIGNTPMGELVAIGAEDGAVRYRQALGGALDSDTPRRLEPVLRSGALYVPHADVHVFRPRDGKKIGTIGPCDLIPDFVRVDEKCDVYVAEESGHMAAWGSGPRLSLVT
jgi:outer membrane protein assembly factor BamB